MLRAVFSPAAAAAEKSPAHSQSSRHAEIVRATESAGKSISYRIPRVYFIYWRSRDIISTLAKISALRTHGER